LGLSGGLKLLTKRSLVRNTGFRFGYIFIERKMLVSKLERKNYLTEIDGDGKIILK
jgi:hypothetical protein